MKFEEMHFSVRYLAYIASSIIIVFVFVARPEEWLISEYNFILCASLITTTLSLMDMAWRQALDGEEDKSDFFIGQLTRIVAGGFIFLGTMTIISSVAKFV
jgi:hypothetical protein